MRIFLAIGLALALALVAGAAQAAPKAPATDANLFVYRVHTDFGWAATLKLDGANAAALGNGVYTASAASRPASMCSPWAGR